MLLTAPCLPLSPPPTLWDPLQFYGYLSQQQNMMQDYVRTGTYQRAILQNHVDFKDKVTVYSRSRCGVSCLYSSSVNNPKV